MESNVEIAIRIKPAFCTNSDVLCVKPNIYNNTIEIGNTQSYPVNYALPNDCTQSVLFATTVTPLINYLFEGCDVSVVTFGQSGSGKSYSILGPGLNCTLSESEYGIIPRFLREVFANVCQNSDRNYLIHVTWTQIFGENVQDLLGAGSVECSSVGEAFELLQLGISNITPQCAHTLFTITLEQQWVIGATVQHRISTASFIDLQSCKKMLLTDSNGLTQSVPTDTGLLTLQQCIWALSEPCIAMYNSNNVVPYNQSALTMLLKDSFGGRAKTLLICCVSPLLTDFMETYYTLQFAMRAQMVKNFVTINSYTTFEMAYESMDLFALQFAANQLFKLVSNAECLFKNLIFNSSLSKTQMEQISQWLTLKQECKDCLSESSEPHRSLERIEEEIEDNRDSLSEESEIICEDDQTSLQHFEELLQNFSLRTDKLVCTANKRYNAITTTKESNNSSSNSEYHLKGARGRRASIHSAEEFIPLYINSSCKTEERTSPEQNVDAKISIKKAGLSYEVKQKVLKQICSEIESYERQISELEVTVQMKEKLVQHLLKHKNTKINVRDKLKQKYQKLQSDQYVAHSKLLQAKSEKNNDMEQKYHTEMCDIAQKLQDAELIKAITEDDSRKIVELENSLCSSKRQLEKLKRHKQKEEKRKVGLENELKRDQKHAKPECASLKSEDKKNSIIRSGTQTPCPPGNKFSIETGQVNAAADVGNLKHEIKELRKTRDFLLEQIYKMDTRSHNRRLLSELEEHKLLQCEEAIEAVDIAIEYKNQMICNCASEASLDQEDQVARMLMEQIMKLNENEIQVLLRKYFEKVIELRSTTKRLEHQMLEVESQNENLVDRIQSFNHTLQRVRSETEHRILSLQQQHENKLQLMMRYLANGETSDGECVASRVVERSKQAALAFKVSQGLDKQVDKGSFIARFTSRYARHETVPRQLQAAITPPQAKVTRQKNKLIIQQSSK